MKPPRLTGTALRAVRAFSATLPGAMLLRAIALRDYQLEDVFALPPDQRLPADLEPRPVQGAAPRQWADGAMGPPPPTGHRRASWQLVEAYRAGRATPSAVLERLLARIEKGEFGAATHSPFVVLDADNARLAARAATQRYREGTARGPLDGVPVPVKDHFDMVGLPSRAGASYRSSVASDDAFMVTKLRDAGALLYGKTHMTEWGMTPTGQNPHFRMPRNAYRADRAAGGSSTGTAVAAALGLGTVGVGSDGGGSIRIPSALNGVFGLKPTFIRVSRTGDVFGGTVGHTGPIGQSTTDLVDWMQIAGTHRDAADPLTRYAPDVPDVAATWRAALGRGVRGCRIGVPEREWRDADPAIARAGEAALVALEREGAQRVALELPGADLAAPIGMLTIGPEALGAMRDDLERVADAFSDDLRTNMNLLRSIRAHEFFVGQQARAGLRRRTATALSTVDVVGLPSTACGAPSYPLDEDFAHVSDAEALRALCRFAFLGNLTGLPAGSVPVGLEDGLPIGLQILGDAWDEASVLAVMAHAERIGLATMPEPNAWFDLLG